MCAKGSALGSRQRLCLWTPRRAFSPFETHLAMEKYDSSNCLRVGSSIPVFLLISAPKGCRSQSESPRPQSLTQQFPQRGSPFPASRHDCIRAVTPSRRPNAMPSHKGSMGRSPSQGWRGQRPLPRGAGGEKPPPGSKGRALGHTSRSAGWAFRVRGANSPRRRR